MNSKTIKKVLNYIGKYKIYLFLSILFATVSTILSLYIPILVGQAIDCIVEKGNVDFDTMGNILAKGAILVLVSAVLQWFMNICNNKITFNVVRDIRMDSIRKIQKLPLRYVDGHSHGEIASRVIADVDQFSEGMLMGFTQFFSGVITILFTLIFMITINLKIALVVIVITPVSLFVAKFIASKTYKMFNLQSQTRGEQTAFINEMIGNLKVVKAYSHEEKNIEAFDDISKRLEEASLDATFYSSTTNPSTRFVNSIVYAGVALSGAIIAVNGGISVGRLTIFLSYANQYTKPFNEISGVIAELQNAIACASRVFELLEEKEEKESANMVQIPVLKGDINMKDVHFSYTDKKKLIEDLNLSVKEGSRVAIVGPTGCGKTTLINLLMRFYELNEGEIKIGENNIASISRHSLRQSIGMVLQDTWLRSGTIKENITMGKPDATMEEIVEAAKAAHAHGFIKRLPKGYDTIIGEDGGNLSQGQKQLLCITRVMLALPPILILDEATSSIDTRTEIKIQQAFEKMMKGRTSFIVAHRLSTIREADIILVMKDGNIIEQGNHSELMEKGGFYTQLYNSQFSGVTTES